MHFPFLALLITTFILDVLAIPYFKPWLETRQSPTPGNPPALRYPDGQSSSTCTVMSSNLWHGDSLQTRKSKKRSTYSEAQSSHGPFMQKRQAKLNETCTQVASFSFSDWEKGYAANTATISIPGGYTYTLSVTANVVITEVQAWSAPINSNSYSVIGKTNPHDFTSLLKLSPTKSISVHFQFSFEYGHPNGNVALFTNQGTPTAATKRRK